MLGTLFFGLALVAISLGLLAWHWNSWRANDHGGLPERERLFFQRQFRRRTNASGAIGFVGLLIMSGVWIENELAYAALALGMLLLVFWIILLALSDWIATRLYFDREQTVQRAQIAVLQSALKREQAKQAAEQPRDRSEE